MAGRVTPNREDFEVGQRVLRTRVACILVASIVELGRGVGLAFYVFFVFFQSSMTRATKDVNTYKKYSYFLPYFGES